MYVLFQSQKPIGTILHRGTCEVLGQVANASQRAAGGIRIYDHK